MIRSLAAVVLLAGCAELPACPELSATLVHTPAGLLLLLDADDFARWRAHLMGALKGECHSDVQR